MRDQWKAQVNAALSRALDMMQERLGDRPKLGYDQTKLGLDIIVPKFTLAPRLHHFSKLSSPAIVRVIGEVWNSVRAEQPELWTYESWYAAWMARSDTRQLSVGDYAERMRRKRQRGEKEDKKTEEGEAEWDAEFE